MPGQLCFTGLQVMERELTCSLTAAHPAAHHFGHYDHVPQADLHHLGLLHGWYLLLALSQALSRESCLYSSRLSGFLTDGASVLFCPRLRLAFPFSCFLAAGEGLEHTVCCKDRILVSPPWEATATEVGQRH